ncbi:MAG: PIN domain-containing protein [Candidatus Eisenbacteria bacterium]|nr:PIN domain-containing protein [Candidatus Eisenbacteria bacterium]
MYLDTSVALAHVLTEDRRPPASFWANSFVSSRLLHYEIWTRLHRLGQSKSSGPRTRALLEVVGILEMTPEMLEPVLDGFGDSVRTLDAIHLASMTWMRDQRMAFKLATYDKRLAAAAAKFGVEVMSPER